MGYATAVKVAPLGRVATMESAEAAWATRQLLKRIFRVGLPANSPTWEQTLAKYGPDASAIIRGAGRSSRLWNAVGFDGALGGAVGVAQEQ